jgi:hypothetical protein
MNILNYYYSKAASFSYNLYYVKWRLKKEARPTGVSRAGKNAHASGVGTTGLSYLRELRSLIGN